MTVGVGIGGIQRAGVGGAGGDTVGEGLLDGAADLAAQFAGTVGRHSVPCQHFGGGRSMGKQIPLHGGADFQFPQQAVGNTSQLFGTEWIKDDDFIQAAHQFGPEIFLGFLYRLFAAAGALGLRSAKTQRGCLPGQAAGTQVGSEQDNGVGKIRPPPLQRGAV